MNSYEIRIRSLLDPSWQDTLGVTTLIHDSQRGETILRGQLDQAQLLGVLNNARTVDIVMLNIAGVLLGTLITVVLTVLKPQRDSSIAKEKGRY